MKGLVSLVRLHRWRVEEKRHHLLGLEMLLADLNRRADDLEREVRVEQLTAARSREAGFLYGNYARRVIARREKLAVSRTELVGQIDQARQAVGEALQEARRYEIVLERAEEEERVELARREQVVQDEVASNMHRRQRAKQAARS